MMKLLAFALVLVTTFSARGQATKVDLVIQHATVFDSRTGALSRKQAIVINDGVILELTRKPKKYVATTAIDARGKLVTPGFIDTHIHPTDVYRSYGVLPEYLPNDSLLLYRKRLSDKFLPYGVTTAVIMGHSEKWLSPILGWQADSRPDYVDLYTVGGALVSNDHRKPYINHVVVPSPVAAKQKVLEYHRLGLRHVKLYWKLRKPEFAAALATADSLGMKTYGHVDQNVMFIDTALALGLRNFEHTLTLVNSVFRNEKDGKDFQVEMRKHYASGTANKQLERLEMFRFVHDKKPVAMQLLIDRLAQRSATFSTSVHLMAEPFGLTYNAAATDTALSPAEMARCRENFKVFMAYVKQAADKGVKLRMGTDWPNGGRALVSEQLLLAEYGFSVPAILQISTLNGATALGLEQQRGVLEKGRKADLLIWDKSPFDNAKNFLAGKTIIKNGRVFRNETAGSPQN